jgi:hypothetical protein
MFLSIDMILTSLVFQPDRLVGGAGRAVAAVAAMVRIEIERSRLKPSASKSMTEPAG